MKKKTLPYLFPPEEIRHIALKGRIIFHREKSVLGGRDAFGPTDRYVVKGFCILEDDPSPTKRIYLGTFAFKGSAQLDKAPKLEIRDEVTLRFIMAAIVLGESSTRYHVGDREISIAKGGVGFKKLPKRQEILRRWADEWTEKPFQDYCKKNNFLPLNQAAESLLSSGMKISVEHLKKHLQRLKLPI